MVEIFHLGPLAGIEDILQCQRVDIKSAADLFEDLHLIAAIHIEPGHRGLRIERETFGHRLDLALHHRQIRAIFE